MRVVVELVGIGQVLLTGRQNLPGLNNGKIFNALARDEKSTPPHSPVTHPASLSTHLLRNTGVGPELQQAARKSRSRLEVAQLKEEVESCAQHQHHVHGLQVAVGEISSHLQGDDTGEVSSSSATVIVSHTHAATEVRCELLFFPPKFIQIRAAVIKYFANRVFNRKF